MEFDVLILPALKCLAVVLRPDLLGHPRFGMAEGDIILNPHHLVVAVAFQIKDNKP